MAVALVAVFFLWRAYPRFTVDRSADRNVLLVTIDTLRADTPGFAGGPAATPNLDRLARDGVWFDFAHAHAVVTLPSHASILTGQYPFAHGIHDNSGYRLGAGVPTLATTLKAAGFATGAFVGAFPLDSRFGLNAGFDRYDDGYPETSRVSDFLMPERPATAVVEQAVRWISGQTGKWFVWVHVFDPHSPYQPPPPFDAQYRANPYAGEVAYTDSALGPLFAVAGSASRPTMTIVTADHGEALGSHGEQTHGLFAYEATLQVPLLLGVPGLRAGRSAISARHADVMPTVFDALGMPRPAGLPGRSLIEALERGGPADADSYFESLSTSINRGWAPLVGVMAGREKYIDLPIPELYDLAVDPAEARNLLPARDDRRRALASRLAAPGATAGAGERRQETSEVLGRLQALGYVSGSAPRKDRYTEADDPKRLVEIDASIQRGIALFQRGAVRDAFALYEQIIARRPDMALGYLHAAYLQWELGDPARAIDLLRRGLAAGAATRELQAQLGIYLAEVGPPAEAIELLSRIAGAEVPDLDALNGLGIALAKAGRANEAITTFEKVLAADATNASALQNVGTVHLQRGDLAAAREALARALAVDPRLPRALNGLGVVELKTGNRAKAIEAWKQAVEVDPRQFDTLYNLGIVLLEDGDRAAARPYFERFLATAPAAFYKDDLAKVREWLARM